MHTRLHEARCAAESEALLSASHTFNQWRYNSLKVLNIGPGGAAINRVHPGTVFTPAARRPFQHVQGGAGHAGMHATEYDNVTQT